MLDVVASAVGEVVPRLPLVLRVSTGATNNQGFEPVPQYAAPVTVTGSIQPLSSKDLRQLDALNIQGSTQKIYLFGDIQGVVRPDNKGGDLITDPQGRIWLVTTVLETWPQWCAVAVTLQDGS